ncbi:MAG: NmrA family transcriptional regulator [Hyphobacterium sp.]|nr:MAG: NmrA family transcriptional regulator [Hyphobacterium sp.]
MPTHIDPPVHSPGLTLVLGGTGKTGRRVANGLQARGIATRIASRSVSPAFSWSNPAGWPTVLSDVKAVYLSYAPDLAIPGATASIRTFTEAAAAAGVQRIVLLSGRGEAEAEACEQIVRDCGLEWTIVRASWFNQNFSEGAFTDMVKSGAINLPVGAIGEPFIDAQDIADVAIAALSETGHTGEIYEVTGPRLLTFTDIAQELSSATGRRITFTSISRAAFLAGVEQSGVPTDIAWLMDYLFTTVLDGRNANITTGVQRALGRAPRDFSLYAAETAQTSVWGRAA